MDTSKEMSVMLGVAMKAHPETFDNFDKTKNVQDRLQEMVGGLEKGFIDFPEWLANVYGLNYGNKPNGHLDIFKTWEQLWLSFVMFELHQKKWDGEKWTT